MKLSGDHNQCPTCLHVFNSTFGFDKHRTGDFKTQSRRCLSVDEMTSKGMSVNSKGFWVTESMSKDALARVGD